MGRHSNGDGAHEITSLPSQAQIAVCHAFHVDENKRGKGLAHKLKMHQNAKLEELRYDLGICTVSENNVKQKAVLERAGWTRIKWFYNRRLCERTEIWCYDVPLP